MITWRSRGLNLTAHGPAKLQALDMTLVGEFGDFFKVGKILGIGLAAVTVISVGGLIFQIAFRSSVRKQAIGVTKTFANKRNGMTRNQKIALFGAIAGSTIAFLIYNRAQKKLLFSTSFRAYWKEKPSLF